MRFGNQPSARHRALGVLTLAGVLLITVIGPDRGVAAAAGLSAAAPPAWAATRFAWPLPPPHSVLRPFRPPTTPYGPGHRGVDLGGYPGEPVLAAGDGLVLYAGPLGGCPLVSIEHPGGLRTTYVPVDPTVGVGRSVSRGAVIGHLLPARSGCPQEVGDPAEVPPAFLYWGVHRDKTYLDPLRLVLSGRIRLLPWPGANR